MRKLSTQMQHLFTASCVISLILTGSVQAAVILNETDPNAADWHYASGGTSPSITGGSSLTVDFGTGVGGNSAYAFRNFSTAAVGIGDSISVSLDITPNANTETFHRRLVFSLFSSNGQTQFNADQSGTDFFSRQYTSLNVQTPLDTLGGSSFNQSRVNGGRHLSSGLSDRNILTEVFGTTADSGIFSPTAGFEQTLTSSFALTLTRNSITEVAVSWSVDGTPVTFSGGTLTNASWDATTWDDFDGIAIGFTSNNAADNAGFTLDNLNITTTPVPEPTSFALIGAGGLLLYLFRRSAKKD
ncbi:MAG: PEP-CTERM sorting domain-containing protein [Verrucomicrobiota bacterium]